jgi:hypothetical protein
MRCGFTALSAAAGVMSTATHVYPVSGVPACLADQAKALLSVASVLRRLDPAALAILTGPGELSMEWALLLSRSRPDVKPDG